MWFLSLSQNILLLCTHPSSGASLIAQLVKTLPAMQETRPWFDSWVRKIPWRRDRPPTPVFLGFPCGSAVKDPPTVQETWVGKIPWRRERPPTPGFWPGEFHGLYNPWSFKESDTTERLSLFTLLLVMI